MKLPLTSCTDAISDNEYVVPFPKIIPAFLQTANTEVINGNSYAIILTTSLEIPIDANGDPDAIPPTIIATEGMINK